MKVVNFNAYSHNATKGQMMTYANFNEFAVYSYRNTSATSSSLYFSTKATGSLSAYNTLAAWSTEGTYYWPFTCTEKGGNTETLSFYGVYPTNLPFNTTDKTVSYTVANAIADQKDLLAADTLNMAYATTVDLQFSHILTNVQFQMMVDGTIANAKRYTVTNLTIGSNLKNAGTYNFTNWTSQSGSAAYQINVTTETPNVTADNTAFGDPMLLMPQATNSVKLSVTYKAEVENGLAGSGLWVETYEGTKEITINVDWKAGQKVVYQITLPTDAQPIQYRTSVEDWNNGGTEIVEL